MKDLPTRLLIALCLTSCAPAANAPPPKAKADPVVAPAEPEKVAQPIALTRGTLSTAPTLAAVGSDANVIVHIDATRLRASPLYSAYREVITEVGQDPLAATRAKCGFDPLESARYITWTGSATGGGKRDFSGVAVLAFDRPTSEVLACVGKSFEGVSALSVGDLVLVGDEAPLHAARERLESRAASEVPEFARTALSVPDAAIAGAMRLPPMGNEVPVSGGELVLVATAQRFLVHTEIEFTNAESAREIERQIDPSRLAAAGIQLSIGRQRTWVQGRRLTHELSIDGGATEQARQIGVLASIGISAVRRYLARAKENEAKSNLVVIAKGLLGHLEDGKAVPASAPRTPKIVPKGSAVTLKPDAWAHPTWKAIAFSIQGKQYYSYEVETAPNRQKIMIRATGDLDGDEVLSKYSLTLTRGKEGAWAIAPEIVSENALE